MLLEIVSALVLAFLAYAVYILFWTKAEPGLGGPIDDFIAAEDEVEISRNHNSNSANKYRTKYEEPGRQVLIIYGTEYGFSEEVARKTFDAFSDNEECTKIDIQPRVVNAKDYKLIEFDKEQVVLCVFSTTGDGVPPSDAREFVDHIKGAGGDEMKPLLSRIHYSVLALGDSCYPHFCSTGRGLDARLKELGTHELSSRVDVDLEDWEAIGQWMERVVATVMSLELSTATDYLDLSQQAEDTGYSRTQPFMARISDKYMLTSVNCEKDKETIHVEVDISGSDMGYTAGDALGIIPQNCQSEVDDLLLALHCKGREKVPTPAFCYKPKPEEARIYLREVLIKYFDLKVVKMELVKLLVESVTSEREKRLGKTLLKDGLTKANSSLADYLSTREVIDVVTDFSTFTCSVEDILKLLKALQPRYYSIASSPVKSSDSVSVCAAVVRYSLLDKPRTGVCTTFLQDRCDIMSTIPVFISTNHDFRLPGKGDVPIIMIGPGTGLAPFRAFIQERILTGATGQSILYFGCRHKDGDFLYHNELEEWASSEVIKLRTAFSRDQRKKVYVQHLIEEDAHLLWDLIDIGGAHVYVCGDAKYMAADVHQALLWILQEEGGKSPSEAEEYMSKLEGAERYQRDVWVT